MTRRNATIPQPEALISHAGFIRAVAQRLLLDDHEVDDVVQQTLLAALEKPPRRELKPWLAAVASNLARMRRRTEGRIKRREKVAARPESMTATATIAERLETQRRLVDAVTSLEGPYRDVIVLRYFDELPPREVAGQLDIPVETVRTRTRRALEQLRTRLDGHPGGRKGWQLALLPLALPPRAAQAAGATAAAGILGAIGMKSILAIAGALFATVILLWNETTTVNGDEPHRIREKPAAEQFGRADAGGDARSADAKEEGGARETATARRDFDFRAIVVDPEGEPVRGARVVGKVRGHNLRDIDQSTGPDGEVEIAGIAGDRDASLRIDHPDYAREFAFVPAWSDETERVVLRRGSEFRVRVVSPAGAAVERAAYKASLTLNSEGAWQYWDFEEEGRCDERGEIDFGRIPRCDLHIEIDHPDYEFFRHKFDAEELASGLLTIQLREGGTIRGIVLHPGGEPLAGASVQAGRRTAKSDADGRFVLAHVSTAGVIVHAEHPDFAPASFGPAIGWRRNVPVRVADGGEVSGIEIRLAAPTRVVGRVVDEQGNPVEWFELQSYCVGGYATGSSPMSDAEGRFRAGPWNISKPTQWLLQRTRTETHRLARTLKVPIEPGQTLDVGDIVVQTRPHLKLRVLLPDGTPVPASRQAEVAFTLTKRHEERAWNDFLFANRSQLQVRPDGSCDLRLDRAIYTVRAWTADGLYSDPRVIDTAGDELDGVELKLKPTVVVSGSIRDGDGNPLRGRRVALLPVEQSIPWQPGAAQRTLANAEGEFELRVSQPGEYWIGVPQNASAQTQEFAKEPKPRRIQVGTEAVERIDLVLGTGATGSGFVVRGRVVSAANGRAIPMHSLSFVRYKFLIPHHTLMTSSWDREGKFETDLDVPGSYACTIKADGYSSVTTKRFEVKKSGSIDLGTIRLPAPLQLTGIVKDAQGVPVPFTQIHLLGAGGQQRGSVYTDNDGRFRIQNSDVGVFNVFAVSPRHPVAVMRGVTIKKGVNNEIEIRMPDSSPLTVTIKDENGRPVEGAEFVYTFPAVAPFTSNEFGGYEPPSFGENVSDAEGIVRKPYMPAAVVTVRILKKGFQTVTRLIPTKKGEPVAIEVVLERN